MLEKSVTFLNQREEKSHPDSAALLVILVIPLAGKVSAGAVNSWADAPFVAFIFPVIGLLLAPVYPAINSIIFRLFAAV